MIPNSERTLILIKPDGIQRGLISTVIRKFQNKAFQLIALKLSNPPIQVFKEHYIEHQHKPFYNDTVQYMITGPVCIMVWEGIDVIAQSRKLNGATHPTQSDIGTIRGDYALDMARGIVHASDSIEAANREIKLWFNENEIVKYL